MIYGTKDSTFLEEKDEFEPRVPSQLRIWCALSDFILS